MMMTNQYTYSGWVNMREKVENQHIHRKWLNQSNLLNRNSHDKENDDDDDGDGDEDDDDGDDDDDQVDSSLEDAGGYFQHTGESINVLLVNNFAEMEEVNKLVIIKMIIIVMIRWSRFSW